MADEEITPEQADRLARLKQFEGQVVGEPFRAHDPVNQPMIRHWCDAMEDDNPVYTNPERAEASAHGGIVAPPGMIQAWTMAGLRGVSQDPEAGPSAQEKIWEILDDGGFTSVVAVSADQEYERYVRPGDHLSCTITIENISPEKKTGLGVGHFITQLYSWATDDGEVVATMRWRLLKFQPRPKKAAKAAPKRQRPRPGITLDNQFFWEGLKDEKLLIQKCSNCGYMQAPPDPMCPKCQSLEWEYVEASGRGSLYSFVVMHYPPVPPFEYPNPIGLVELEEGVRMVTNLIDVEKDDIRIGMPLEVTFKKIDDDLTLHQWRPARA